MNTNSDAGQLVNVGAERKSVMISMLIAAPLALGLWNAIATLMPPIAGMDDPWSRLWFALKCCCVAMLLCLFLGVEAVAHERLNSSAINPLAGVQSARMRVNQRYLQNTLEQSLLFVTGLLALAGYCSNGESMRAVVATSVVWIVSRLVFWIGYHIAPRFRAPGLVGMVQSMLVLLYVCDRFGREIAGRAGEAAIWIIFLGVEAYLVYLSFLRKPST